MSTRTNLLPALYGNGEGRRGRSSGKGGKQGRAHGLGLAWNALGEYQKAISHFTFPFSIHAAGCQEQDVINGRPKRHRTADLEDARHGLARMHAVIGEGRNGADIVSQQNPSLLSRPLQHARVICTSEADVLNPDQINASLSKTNPTNGVIVEVLVREQPDHDEPGSAWRADRRARIPVGLKSRSFACLTATARCSRAWR